MHGQQNIKIILFVATVSQSLQFLLLYLNQANPCTNFKILNLIQLYANEKVKRTVLLTAFLTNALNLHIQTSHWMTLTIAIHLSFSYLHKIHVNVIHA